MLAPGYKIDAGIQNKAIVAHMMIIILYGYENWNFNYTSLNRRFHIMISLSDEDKTSI